MGSRFQLAAAAGFAAPCGFDPAGHARRPVSPERHPGLMLRIRRCLETTRNAILGDVIPVLVMRGDPDLLCPLFVSRVQVVQDYIDGL